jgi:hypothetical protein
MDSVSCHHLIASLNVMSLTNRTPTHETQSIDFDVSYITHLRVTLLAEYSFSRDLVAN